MYRTIRENPDKSYMFVTPYLATIQDAIDAGLDIRQPEYKGSTKADSLKYLLSHGYNIGCTHSLFLDADDELLDIIQNGDYTLFIDEALDVIKPVNDLIDDPGHRVKKGTAKFLVQQGIIKVDPQGRVIWCGEHVGDDYEYAYLEPLAKSGNVLCIDNQLFLWMFPPKIFHVFRNVIILSYLFRGSVFDAYLKIHDLNYEMGGVAGNYDDGFTFCDYADDQGARRELAKLIDIYWGKANLIGEKRYDLSKSWYDAATDADMKIVRTSFNTFLKNATGKMPNATTMWTCFKEQKESLQIRGAGYVRKLTPEETEAMKADPECKNKELNRLRCFTSCNVRATNDYDDRQILAFLVNRFYQPQIKKWLASVYGIKLSEDCFALSELVQWVWRSRIRRSSLPDQERKIFVFIPSKRMRNLFQAWLSGEQF